MNDHKNNNNSPKDSDNKTNGNYNLANNNDNINDRNSTKDSGWQLSFEFRWPMFKLHEIDLIKTIKFIHES